MSHKEIKLKPEISFYLFRIITAILLIPVFGIGLYLLYKLKGEIDTTVYTITDYSITARTPDYSENVDLVNIEDIGISQSNIQKKFRIGTLYIKTDSRNLKLEGLRTPRELAHMILKAAEAERARVAGMKKVKQRESESIPIATDKLDYLTGLWQQGLLSEEDFLKEKKHFEP